MWLLKRWDVSYAVHLWKVRSGKYTKEYRIWIYTFPKSFHTRVFEVVSQIQHDAPWKLFDTYLTGLDVASINKRQII